MKKWTTVMAIIMVASLVLSACEPQVVEKEVIVTQVVEVPKEIVVTEIVEVEGEERIVEVTKIITEEVVVEVTPEPKVEGEKVGGPGDVYRVAVLADMTTQNPWAYYDPDSSTWNGVVIGGFWPNLFTNGDLRFDYVPSLAADFASDLEEEGDFWVSTVPLKENFLWSDGTEVTAEDVAWTANIVLTLQLSGNWADYDSDFLDHVEAVDPYTAKFYYHTKPGLARHQFGALQQPILSQAFWEPMVAPLMEQFAEIAELDPESEEYLAQREEILQALYILDTSGEPSAGPWMFSQWEPGAYAEIVANPYFSLKGEEITLYENGAYQSVLNGQEFIAYGAAEGEVVLDFVTGPYFERVLFTLYSKDAAILALEAGEVDYIIDPNGLSRGNLGQLANNPSIEVTENPKNGYRYLTFNMERPPLDDLAMRQAINCMINKQFLTENLMQNEALPVYTPVPLGNAFWYNPDVAIYCQGLTEQERMEEAVRILTEAGYTWDVAPVWNEARGGSVEWGQGLMMPNGEYVPEMELLAPSAGYDPLRATAGVYIEQWIQQLGFPVKAELTNFNNILNAWFDEDDYDMFIMGWTLGTILFPTYVCDFFTTGQTQNSANFSDAEFDALCDEFYAASDIETARELSFRAQEMLATNLPQVLLFTTPQRDGYNGDAVLYPYTEILNGIYGQSGMKQNVMAVQ